MIKQALQQCIAKLRQKADFRSNYLKDIAWLSYGASISQLLVVAATPLFTRLYLPDHFATLNLFVSTISMASLFCSFRYEYFIQLPKRKCDSLRLVVFIMFLCICSFVLLTAVGIIGVLGFRMPVWILLVPITCVAIVAANTFRFWCQRTNSYRRAGEADILGRIAYVIIGISGAYLFANSFGLLIATFSQYVARTAWQLKCIKVSHFLLPIRTWRKVLGQAKKYLPLSLAALSGAFLFSGNQLILNLSMNYLYGSVNLGKFAMALFIVTFPSTLLGNAVSNTYHHRAAIKWARGQPFSGLWRSTISWAIIVALPCYILGFFLFPIFLPWILGENWLETGQYASILCIGGFFGFIEPIVDKNAWIVGVLYFDPIWNAGRLVLLVTILILASTWNLGVVEFAWLYSLKKVVVYSIGLFCQWHFMRQAHRNFTMSKIE